MNHPNSEIMQKAIKLAAENHDKDKQVVAAIILKGDKIISEGFTSVKEDSDPTAHAEINAIRKAAKKLNSHKLEGCWLYTTVEPCPMCASACVWARMEGIVYGANMSDANDKITQKVKVKSEEVIANGDPKLKVYGDFMRAECKALYP